MPPNKSNVPSRVVVHPIVLLSVVDHFNRLSRVGNQRRVVGVLLGSWRKGNVVDIATSFAVPFDEDERDRSVWFLDHDYLESMAAMFKKVNSRERIVGWYHTGPKLNPNDMAVHQLIGKFCTIPVLVIVDAKPKALGLPTDAYYAVEEVHDDGTPTTRTYEHVGSEIGAEEAEEVGVEHLLRDIQDKTVGTLSQSISSQLQSLHGLQTHLAGIREYLQKVSLGKLPMNHPILYQLQDVFNLLPNLSIEEFSRSFAVKTNDQLLVVYVASLIRSVIALDNLIGNKLSIGEAEKKDVEKKKEDQKSKKAEGEEGKGATGKGKEGDGKKGKEGDGKKGKEGDGKKGKEGDGTGKKGGKGEADKDSSKGKTPKKK